MGGEALIIVVKYTCIVIGVAGIFLSLDLIFGAKITLASRKVLDKASDIVDKTITNSTTRKASGVLLLAFSLIILFLVSRVRG